MTDRTVRAPPVEGLALRDATLLSCGSYIAGDFRAIGARKVVVKNPANDGIVSTVASATNADLDCAVQSCADAFVEWRTVPPRTRSEVLLRWAALVTDARDDLSRIITLENGKPLRESAAEVDYGVSYMKWYAAEAERSSGTSVTQIREDLCGVTRRKPVGVCVILTPFNFPFAMLARKVAPALAAGCTCVVKPSPETPLTSLVFAELSRRAGVPAGVCNVVVCREAQSDPAVERILRAPPVRLVSFTGSCRVGVAVSRLASDNMLRTCMELGSPGAPFIIFDDADLGVAVDALMAAKFRASGQACIAADRVLVQDGVLDAVLALLRERVIALAAHVGNGLLDGITVGPLINRAAVDRVAALVTDALNAGAVLEVGGVPNSVRRRREPSSPSPDSQPRSPQIFINGNRSPSSALPPTAFPAYDGTAGDGCFFPPTLLSNVQPGMSIFKEELFGPVIAVCSFPDDVAALAAARAGPVGGLGAYVFSRSLARADAAAAALDVGMVAVNCAELSDARTPFGGTGASGHAREGGPGLADYTHSKYVLTRR